MKLLMWFCWISLIAIPDQTEPHTIPAVKPEIAALLKSLNNKEPAVRLAAAEQLAKVCDPGIVSELKARIPIERDADLSIAMNYALAAQRDADGFAALVNSLGRGRNFAAMYLERLTGRHYGPDKNQWTQFRKDISESDFNKALRRHRIPDAMREEGRKEYLTVAKTLREGPDPKKLFPLLKKLVTDYPQSDYADDARELLDLFKKMDEEDRTWVEPSDISLLPTDKAIEFNCYHLRNLRCSQATFPGVCDVVSKGTTDSGTYNAAIALEKLGTDAIPALVAMLGDRRPTRTYVFHRPNSGKVAILRNQDAAMQILNMVLPCEYYRPRSSMGYFSLEHPEVRKKIALFIEDWQEKAKGKPLSQSKWLAIKMGADTRVCVDLLRSLAGEGEKDAVLKELHKLYKTSHWIYRPVIVDLMAELGDLSLVDNIVELLDSGAYRDGIELPGDRSPGINSEEIAEKLKGKYKTAKGK